MAAKAQSLKVLITGDARSLNQTLDSTEKRSRSWGATFAKAGKAAAAGVAGLGVAAVAAAFKTAQHADATIKSARAAGLGAESYQELRYALGQAGIDQAKFDNAANRLTKTIGDAAAGNETAADAFSALGVSIRDANGELRSSDAVMDDTLASLAAMPNAAERSAAASELFGRRAGPELAGALATGIEGIDAARDRAHELGIVLGEDTLVQAERFNDTWDDVKQGLLGFMHQGATPVMGFLADRLFPFLRDTAIPIVRRFGEGIKGLFDLVAHGDFTKGFGQAFGLSEDSPIVAGLFRLRETAIAVFEGIRSWIDGTLVPAFHRLSRWWDEHVPGIVAWVTTVGTEVRTVVTGALADLAAWWEEHGPTITTAVNDVKDAVVKFGTRVKEEWDELIKQLHEDTDDWVIRYNTMKESVQTFGDAIGRTLGAIAGIFDTLSGKQSTSEAKTISWGAVIGRIAGAVFDALAAPTHQAAWLATQVARYFEQVRGSMNIMRAGFASLLQRGRDAMNALALAVGVSMTAITQGLSTGLATIRSIIGVALTSIRSMWNQAWTAVKDFVAARLSDVVGFFRALPGRVTGAMTDIGGRIRRFLGGQLETVKTRIRDKLDDLVQYFKDLPGRIVSALGSVGSKIASAFKFSLSGSGEGDGPGAPVGPGGKAMDRARQIGAGLPIVMTSSYRTPARNRAVGGSPTSYHMDAGNPASDWVGPTWALDEFAARLRRAGGWRELLWRVPNHAPGDNPHVHVAHDGGYVTRQGIKPLGSDELDTRLQVGETVLPKGVRRGGDGGDLAALLREQNRLAERQARLTEEQNRLLAQSVGRPAVFNLNSRAFAEATVSDMQEELRIRQLR